MSSDPITVGAPFGTGNNRVIMNIIGGTLRGPGLAGEILEHGGADWGVSVQGSDVCLISNCINPSSGICY